MMEKNSSENISRRNFLHKAWGWLGLIAGLELAGLSFSFLAPLRNNNRSGKAGLMSVGNVNGIPAGTVLPFRSGKFYLVRMADGGFIALSLICSHLGCSVTWNREEQKFICPCHSSQFDMKGNVLSRPAPRPLDYYKVVIREGEVLVDPGSPIRRKSFENTQVAYV